MEGLGTYVAQTRVFPCGFSKYPKLVGKQDTWDSLKMYL